MVYRRILLLTVCALLIGIEILHTTAAGYNQKILQARADLLPEHAENTLLLTSSAQNPVDLKASLIRLKSDYHLTGIQALSDANSSFEVSFAEDEDLALIMATHSNEMTFEPDYILTATATPTDPLFHEQWYLNNNAQTYHTSATTQTTGTNDIDTNWQEAYDNHSERGVGITIAVIDSGLNVVHPDLVTNLWNNSSETADGVDNDGNSFIDDINGWNFIRDTTDLTDGLGHGTAAAGIMVAKNDTVGIVGIASQAKVMTLKVLDNQGRGRTSNVIRAINYAVAKEAHVINMSFGGAGADSVSLVTACNNAVQAGIVLVAAAGNGNTDINTTHFAPANIPSVIAVGSITNSGAKASFSNTGTALSLVTPGVSLLTTRSGGSAESTDHVLADGSNNYIVVSGTSFSSPMVAATAALLLQQAPEKTPAQIRTLLESTARDLGTAGRDSQFGYGLMDINAALQSGIVDTPLPTNAAPIIVSATWDNDQIANDDTSSAILTMVVTDSEDDDLLVQADLSSLGSSNETLTNTTSNVYQSLAITTATDAGSYTIPLQVSDATHTTTGSIILTITDAPPTLVITGPTADLTYTTSTENLTLSGSVSNRISSITINDTPISSFSVGQLSWSQSITVPEGTTVYNVNGFSSSSQLQTSDSIIITRAASAPVTSFITVTPTSEPVTRTRRTTRRRYDPDPVVTAQNLASNFSDIPSNHFATQQIADLQQKGAIQGINSFFFPDRPISRGEFLKIAMHDAGLTNADCGAIPAQFTDTATSSFRDHINCGVIQHVLHNTATTFSPYSALTREQAILWLVAIRRVAVASGTQSSFTDVQDILTAPYINTAYQHRWITGFNGLFYPKNNLTRAEAVKIIVNSRH